MSDLFPFNIVLETNLSGREGVFSPPVYTGLSDPPDPLKLHEEGRGPIEGKGNPRGLCAGRVSSEAPPDTSKTGTVVSLKTKSPKFVPNVIEARTLLSCTLFWVVAQGRESVRVFVYHVLKKSYLSRRVTVTYVNGWSHG